MNVALAGCRAVESWPVAPTAEDPRPWERDDRPLHAALRARGAAVATPAWDDPDVDWATFDVVVPRATWDYHHRRDAFVAWAERVGPRLRNPAAVIAWNTDKRYLRELPVPQPDTVWLGAGIDPTGGSARLVPPGIDLRAILAAKGWERAFLKPVVGATAEGTLRFGADAIERAEAHLAEWLPRGEMLLQPYLAAVEHAGERSAIWIDGAVTHWVRKIPVPGDYRVQDDWGARDEPHRPDPAEEALVEAALRALPAGVVYARVDWLLADDGPRLVELELVEPCLFFRHGPGAADRLAHALVAG